MGLRSSRSSGIAIEIEAEHIGETILRRGRWCREHCRQSYRPHGHVEGRHGAIGRADLPATPIASSPTIIPREFGVQRFALAVVRPLVNPSERLDLCGDQAAVLLGAAAGELLQFGENLGGRAFAEGADDAVTQAVVGVAGSEDGAAREVEIGLAETARQRSWSDLLPLCPNHRRELLCIPRFGQAARGRENPSAPDTMPSNSAG